MLLRHYSEYVTFRQRIISIDRLTYHFGIVAGQLGATVNNLIWYII